MKMPLSVRIGRVRRGIGGKLLAAACRLDRSRIYVLFETQEHPASDLQMSLRRDRVDDPIGIMPRADQEKQILFAIEHYQQLMNEHLRLERIEHDLKRQAPGLYADQLD